MKTSRKDESLEGRETLLVREHLLHLLRLEQFIRSYVENQQCINLEDIVYGALQLNLDDEQMRELLKQFVFFLLQSNHPLKDYTKIHPTAPAFVSRLQKNLLKDKFPVFLQTYRDNAFPIPPTIAIVLEATNLDPEAMRQQLFAAIKQERKRIYKKVYEHLRRNLREDDPFWKRFEGMRQLPDPTSLVDELLTQYQGAINNKEELETQKRDLERRLDTCTKAQEALQRQKAEIDARVSALEGELRGKAGIEAQLTALREQKAAVDAQLAERDATLAAQRRECEEQIRELERASEGLESQNQDLKQEIFAQRNRLEEL
jgi:chaperonin cofactor prefoldin